jgi:uncharacterized membrane protein
VVGLTQHELSQDNHDFLATHALHYANGLTGSAVFLGALYLLSHGLVKVVLVYALLKWSDRRWALEDCRPYASWMVGGVTRQSG